jgi:hypothetical protein
MYKTILQLFWPFIQGYLKKRAAEYTADYLQKRRERRLKKLSGAEEAALQEPMLACPTSTAEAIWYTLSGVLLGSALSLILAQLFWRED